MEQHPQLTRKRRRAFGPDSVRVASKLETPLPVA